MKWIKASEWEEIYFPICAKIDGGGAPYYTTVCCNEDLQNLVSKYNPIDEIMLLQEGESQPTDAEIETMAEKEFPDYITFQCIT